jgi:hypothetical protein
MKEGNKMNCYEAMLRMIEIDKELQKLGSEKVNLVENSNEYQVIEQEMNTLDTEFLVLKHSLQDTTLIIREKF